MVAGVERGSIGTVDNWKGDGIIDGKLTVSSADSSIKGYLRIKEIPFNAATWGGSYVGAVKDSGWDIPAGAIVKRCYTVMTAIHAAKVLNVGTTVGSPVEFLNGMSMTTGKTGLQNGHPTFTVGTTESYWANDCQVGATLLGGFKAGSDSAGLHGVFALKEAYFATATRLYFGATTGTATAAGKIVIEYVV